MTRFSNVTVDSIAYELSLILDKKGNARMTRARGSIGAGERELRMRVVVPKSIFETPSLRATVTLEDKDGECSKLVADVTAEATSALKRLPFSILIEPVDGR